MIFYRVMDDLLTDSLYEELNDECGWQEVEAEGEGEGGIRQRMMVLRIYDRINTDTRS